jgi:DNA-binding transcriptional regulator YiaG
MAAADLAAFQRHRRRALAREDALHPITCARLHWKGWGMSREACAALAGLSVSGLGKIERNEVKPRPATLNALAVVLEVHPDTLRP